MSGKIRTYKIELTDAEVDYLFDWVEDIILVRRGRTESEKKIARRIRNKLHREFRAATLERGSY